MAAIASGATLVVLTACSASDGTVFPRAALDRTPASVVVTPPSAELRDGDTLTISALVEDARGRPVVGATVAWSSSDTLVVLVSSQGQLTAMTPGSATITAVSAQKSAAAVVNVMAVVPPDAASPPSTAPAPTAAIVVAPGESIQAKVEANPAGTTFLLKSGVHVRQSVVPKEGNVFRGEPGTVLDGQNATAFAFRGWNGSRWINSVAVRNLSITRYTPPAQNGAIWGGDDLTRGTTGWVLDSLDVSYNANLGVRIGNRMRVTNSHLHHNSTLNIGGIGAAVLIEGNEIAYGNWRFASDPGFESGGTKFVKTDSLVVRNNYVHDNGGPGIWTDIDNVHVLIENNRVEANAREGIVHEIGYSAVIRNNSVTGNGTGDPYRGQGWLWNAGIGIHASRDVEVYGNTVSGNANGIVAVQQVRGAGRLGAHIVENLWVHDNRITQGVGPAGSLGVAAGVVQDVGDRAIFTSRNNRFQNNIYTLGTTARPFAWQNAACTVTEWRGYGLDMAGSFEVE